MANSCSSRSSCWKSSQQQDAHEFFTALLEEVQGEVLLAEVGRLGGHNTGRGCLLVLCTLCRQRVPQRACQQHGLGAAAVDPSTGRPAQAGAQAMAGCA